jgi:hypothetical protein
VGHAVLPVGTVGPHAREVGGRVRGDHSPDVNDLPLPDLMRDGGESLRKLGLLGEWDVACQKLHERRAVAAGPPPEGRVAYFWLAGTNDPDDPYADTYVEAVVGAFGPDSGAEVYPTEAPFPLPGERTVRAALTVTTEHGQPLVIVDATSW